MIRSSCLRRGVVALAALSFLAVAAPAAHAYDPYIIAAKGPTTNATSRTYKVLVIPYRYGNDPGGSSVDSATAEEPSKAALLNTFTAAAGFFNEVSWGSLTLQPRVIDYQVIPKDRPTTDVCQKDQARLDRELNNAALVAGSWLQAQGGPTIDDYELLAFVSDSTSPDCDKPGGAREQPTAAGLGVRQSYFINKGGAGPNLYAAVHELGHNLGLAHASSLAGSTSGAAGPLVPIQVPMLSSPTTSYNDPATREYDDESDAMGLDKLTRVVGYSAVARARVGMLPGVNVETITPTATTQSVVLTGLGRPLNGTKQLIKIARPYAANNNIADDDFFYVDFRRSNSSFSPAKTFELPSPSDPFVNGVSVRLGDDYAKNASGPSAGGAWVPFALVNASPGATATARWAGNARRVVEENQDHVLRVGEQIYDAAANITIALTNMGTNNAVVSVKTGPPTGNATTVTRTGNTVQVQAGTGAVNNVYASYHEINGTKYVVVVDNGNTITPGTGCNYMYADPLKVVACPVTTTTPQININLGDLDDQATIDPGVNPGTVTNINGGDGNDILEGAASTDNMNPGNGTDLIATNDGADTSSLLDGSVDILDCGGPNQDTITQDTIDSLKHCS